MQNKEKTVMVSEVDFESQFKEEVTGIQFDEKLYQISQNAQLVGFATQGMAVRVY